MAWTVTETLNVWPVKALLYDELVEITLTCVSDASTTDYQISETSMQQIRGGYLYEVKVIPGAGADAPTAAFDLDLEDVDNAHILDTNSNSETAITFHDGAATIGHYPIIKESLSAVFGTLGNLNTAVVIISVLK